MAEALGEEILLNARQIARRVARLARDLAPSLDDETVALCLLIGGLWFAADLTRALAREGRRVAFDALWLASYGDNRESGGSCQVRATPQRTLAGRAVLIVDDVVDSGHSLAEAVRIVREAGAEKITTAVFARKPWPGRRALEPDHVAWQAPPRFLVGYGMDLAGASRGVPYVAAAD